MDIVSLIVSKILPLYALIGLGYFAGKKLEVDAQGIARFLIYIIAPFVILEACLKIELRLDIIYLPFLYFLAALIMIGFSLFIGRLFLTGAKVNLYAVSCFWKNSGYFGIPVALTLFPADIAALYIVMTFGSVFVEFTMGFYLLARGQYSARDSFIKLIRLPLLYAAALGLTLNALEFQAPQALSDMFISMKGAFIIFGMAVIGINLGRMERFTIDMKLTAPILGTHCFLWPALMAGLLYLDSILTMAIPALYYPIFMLVSVLPIGANVALYASELNVEPAKASTIVFISTLSGVITVPIAVHFLF